MLDPPHLGLGVGVRVPSSGGKDIAEGGGCFKWQGGTFTVGGGGEGVGAVFEHALGEGLLVGGRLDPEVGLFHVAQAICRFPLPLIHYGVEADANGMPLIG